MRVKQTNVGSVSEILHSILVFNSLKISLGLTNIHNQLQVYFSSFTCRTVSNTMFAIWSALYLGFRLLTPLWGALGGKDVVHGLTDEHTLYAG